jgi:hypothetical protein
MEFPTLTSATIMAFTYSTPSFSFIIIYTYINNYFHILLEISLREPEDEESTLYAVLDSLVPYIYGNATTVQLPIFLGKSVTNHVVGKEEDSSSRSNFGEVDKEFAWSRGIGIEISSIKTRSARKKDNVETSQILVSHLFTEDGALRVVKALTRSK